MNVSENTNVEMKEMHFINIDKIDKNSLVSLTVKWNNEIANSPIIWAFCLPIILTLNCEFGILHLHKHKNVKVE